MSQNQGNQQYQNQFRGNQRGRGRARGRFRGNSRYQNQRRGNFQNRNKPSYDDEQSEDNYSDGDNDNSGYDDNNTNSDEENTNNDSNDSDSQEENDDYDDEEEEEEDDDEFERLKEGDDKDHNAAPDKDVFDKAKSIDFTPAKSSIDPNFRSKEVYPFIEAYIKAYNSNSTFLPEFYTEDAVFSLTFKKMPRDSEVAALFEDNRNMKFHPKIPPVSGGQNILDFLKTKFKQGSGIDAIEKHVQFVSRLLFAVNIIGTINLYKNDDEMKTVKCVKTLVVIGRSGKLLITNDHLAICM